MRASWWACLVTASRPVRVGCASLNVRGGVTWRALLTKLSKRKSLFIGSWHGKSQWHT
jgi:hypothetical protein